MLCNCDSSTLGGGAAIISVYNIAIARVIKCAASNSESAGAYFDDGVVIRGESAATNRNLAIWLRRINGVAVN